MKSLFVMTSIAFLMMFSSCTKKVELDVQAVEALSLLSQEVLNETSVPEMKQAYLMLSNKEKEALWKTKYATILKNDEGKLSSEQSLLIKKLQTFLITNGMDKIFSDSKIGEKFINVNLTAFERAFTKSQQFFLVECPYFSNDFSIVGTNDLTIKSILQTRKATNEINRAGFSDEEEEVDDLGLTAKCTCRYNLGCPGSGNNCDTNTDCTKAGGCGLFSGSSCLGRCEGFQPST